ncbi:MlaA family lipoprotein [Marinobacterium sediminicola]|uniref:Phospholipid-binding lipoprotein MlaA n=1 Tax=Marinobacterium sediminicola TaxID=518898 RepID=A0ABY1RX27_9GAMM|nr:VacJ family lipoprotein [Marinobacterium sediminicola]ULG67916.1 VacJ family lipoprotein [Marinobacterium sediminicola]SMR71375.1 phospholipid-binding lipoprotein MlaA [Marinobacterium sediminicola]
MLTSSLRSGITAASLGVVLVAAPVMAETEQDPWEGFNRSIYSFNETVDRYALKPLAQGYRYVTPDVAEKGVSNFFDNIADVGNLFNNLLQFKFEAAGKTFARLTFNSTFGLAGLIDVATPMGIEAHEEDFGQTLGYWGVGSGPYLMLPLLGPSTVRDGLAKPVDWMVDPVGDVDHVPTRNTLYGLRLVDTRSRLLKAEQIISGDKYAFIRDAYLQRREYQINDGAVKVKYDSDF